MVVAGDHANNDMAGDDDDSWKSQFVASGNFDSVDCQIAGLGEIDAIQQIYAAHTKAAIDSLGDIATAASADRVMPCRWNLLCKIRYRQQHVSCK